MAANSKRSTPNETKFTEAEKNWNLEKLYEDLRAAKQRCGSAKRKILTDTEKCHLRGLLCGYSPEAIANERGVGFGSVNDALSKTLYCYIQELLDYKKKIRYWENVPDFLEQGGYKIQRSEQFHPNHPLPDNNENTLEMTHSVNSILEWRFKSVDQLWSKDIGECISGIRKLERIAKDYPTEHWAIMEELAEFIRVMAPRKEEGQGEEELVPSIPDIPGYIQAALNVIKQRDPKKDPLKKKVDLSSTDIRGADLTKANLQGASLVGADLRGAVLGEANLQGAVLGRTNLQGALLILVNLAGADLFLANLEGAILIAANLERAYLSAANLQGAKLAFANLQGTDLTKAKNLELEQIKSARGDSTTSLPNNLQDFREEILAHWEQSK